MMTFICITGFLMITVFVVTLKASKAIGYVRPGCSGGCRNCDCN